MHCIHFRTTFALDWNEFFEIFLAAILEDIFFSRHKLFFYVFQQLRRNLRDFCICDRTKYAKHKKWNKMVYDASLYRDWFKSYSLLKLKMVASSYM